MTETFKAIFENGVLRPLQPLSGVPENQPIDVTVIVAGAAHPLSDCFGILPDADARDLTQIIDAEFERIDPDEWK